MELKIKSLLFAFLFSQVITIIPLISDSKAFSNSTVVFCILCISPVIGVYFLSLFKKRKNSAKHSIYLSENFFRFSFLLSIFGIYIVFIFFLQFNSIDEYLTKLLKPNAEKEGGIDLWRYSNTDNKIPGYLQIFSSMPLAIYLLLFSIMEFFTISEKQKGKVKVMIIISAILVLIKSLIYLDRLSILAIATPLFFYFKPNKFRILVFATIVFAIANFSSSGRGFNGGIQETIHQYTILHMENLNKNILSYSGSFTLGLKSILFFHVFYYMVLGRFGGMDTFNPDIQYVQQDAHNFITFTYVDFGWYSPFSYLIWALCLLKLNNLAFYSNVKVVKLLFYIILYDLFSFFTVPAHTGPDYWAAVIATLFLSIFLK